VRAAGAIIAALLACSDPPPPDTSSPALGHELGAGLERAIEVSSGLREPYRCAESAAPAPASARLASGRSLSVTGDTLTIGRGKGGLAIGVVADARGATGETEGNLARIRAAFVKDKVDLVISLGGMGTSEEELAAVHKALAGPWALWAIPGDRESIPAHRAALAGLPAAFDGSRVRMVAVDGALLASVPGAASRGRLIAGADGCLHAPGDALALATRLAAHRGVRVWAGHAAPRQRGPAAGDLALGGVHVGDLALADALGAARAHLVLHGTVDQAALGAATGPMRLADGAPAVVLGAGPVEGMPVAGLRGPRIGRPTSPDRATEGRVDRPRGRRLRSTDRQRSA
jgi:hypothetical protein